MLGIFFLLLPSPASTLSHPALCPARRMSWTAGTGSLVKIVSCLFPSTREYLLSLGAAFGHKDFHRLSPGWGAFASILSPETVHLCLNTECGKKSVLSFLHRDGFASTSAAMQDARSFAASCRQLKISASCERGIRAQRP